MNDSDRHEDEGPMSEPPVSDRRTSTRHLAVFPAHVDTGTGTKRTAVIRDLSVTGALLLTRARVKVGDEITLSLYLTGDPTQAREVKGRIVRDERRSLEVSDVWPYAAAVHFDEPLADLEDDVKALAQKQASLGLTPER
jgi:hypothetical protein